MQIKTPQGIRSGKLNLGARERFAIRWLGLFTGLWLVSGCTATQPDSRADWPADIGFPVATDAGLRVLQNKGFAIGYSETAERAAWVAYRVTPITDYQPMPRPHFLPDPRLAHDSPSRVYAGPAYDRGHLAPNYAISQLYGPSAQQQTFYYSNVVPQRPRLNQLVWQRLEEIEIDVIAPRVGTLWVLLGPVPGAEGTAPAAFYRIWLARTAESDTWQALAFVVPQDVRGDERLDRFRVSIDRIESATGLDFLAAQPASVQHRLEAATAPASLFGFAEFACQPARYGRRWDNRESIRLRYDRCSSH